jgi:hypothetical protein
MGAGRKFVCLGVERLRGCEGRMRPVSRLTRVCTPRRARRFHQVEQHPLADPAAAGIRARFASDLELAMVRPISLSAPQPASRSPPMRSRRSRTSSRKPFRGMAVNAAGRRAGAHLRQVHVDEVPYLGLIGRRAGSAGSQAAVPGAWGPAPAIPPASIGSALRIANRMKGIVISRSSATDDPPLLAQIRDRRRRRIAT